MKVLHWRNMEQFICEVYKSIWQCYLKMFLKNSQPVVTGPRPKSPMKGRINIQYFLGICQNGFRKVLCIFLKRFPLFKFHFIFSTLEYFQDGFLLFMESFIFILWGNLLTMDVRIGEKYFNSYQNTIYCNKIAWLWDVFLCVANLYNIICIRFLI